MDGSKINKLTFGQSASLWWAITWRTILICIIPMLLANFLLAKGLGFDESTVSLVQNLIFIPVMIQVQRHVINRQGFNGFDIQVKDIESDK